MQQFFSVGQAAKILGLDARVLSDAFYRGTLRADLCPNVAGRRLIPSHYLATIRAVLICEGKLPPNAPVADALRLATATA